MAINLIVESFDKYETSFKENVKGKFENEDEIIKCSYNSELGFCEIVREKEKVFMVRKGSNSINLYFDNLGNGECQIKNEYFEKNLFIKNGKIELDKKFLEISYELYDFKEEFNSLRIRVTKF